MKKALMKFGLYLCFILASPAWGHFQLNINIRIVHIEHLNDGLRVYLRLPTPYVLANQLGSGRSDGTVEPAPYTSNEVLNGELMHFVDFAAFESDPNGLGGMVADGHSLKVDGKQLEGRIEQVRIHTADSQPPFATLEEAQAAFALPAGRNDDQRIFVGNTVTDVRIHYPSRNTVYQYQFSSSLDPELENQEETANLILDHFLGTTQIFRNTGLLADPLEVSHSALAAGLTFVKEGIVHILKGFDHVLFVVCLIIGATTLSNLIWRVTGFTVGHTLTLSLGFFGWAPEASWFIPAVETGIALSIIYAAIIALVHTEQKSTFMVTTAIGLLHGLGFSFVLQEILQVNSPNIWQSLLAFNIGVELGQVSIVLLIWPVLFWLGKAYPSASHTMRWIIAVPCIAISAVWTGERLAQIWQSIS